MTEPFDTVLASKMKHSSAAVSDSPLSPSSCLDAVNRLEPQQLPCEQEGRTKTCRCIFQDYLLPETPTASYLWNFYYKRKINPYCWIYCLLAIACLQLNIFLINMSLHLLHIFPKHIWNYSFLIIKVPWNNSLCNKGS